jgi:hypothetical protein
MYVAQSFVLVYTKYMEKTLNIHLKENKEGLIRKIQAFAGDYSHNIDGKDVIIVEQLIDFLGQ